MTTKVTLEPFRRGTEFSYSTTLTNGWTGAMFTGGLLFTIRRELPESTIVDDTDDGVVHQASLGDEITVTDDTDLTVLIPASETNTWPTGKLFWDLQGIVTIGARVLDVAAGTLIVTADVTRTI